MEHQFIVTVKSDGRYDSPPKADLLKDLIGGRVWTIDGVHHNGVEIEKVGSNVAVVPVRELERLRAFERDHTAAGGV